METDTIELLSLTSICVFVEAFEEVQLVKAQNAKYKEVVSVNPVETNYSE
jgi:hypothetical protein